MTSPLEFVWLTLVTGPDTKPEHLPLAGRIVGVPSGTDIGSGPTNPGTINGISGYPQPAPPGSPTALEWVLSDTLPTVAKDFIHNLPDNGWVAGEGEDTYRAMATALLERDIPMTDVGTLLQALHDSAVGNERAQP